ncbi:Coiled-coil and C2 domain-containing protein 1-like [Echinococcus granulosus]|nr:Coiled-coil and C2 domain-containing protein 1-like [Echinococcus granulosus]
MESKTGSGGKLPIERRRKPRSAAGSRRRPLVRRFTVPAPDKNPSRLSESPMLANVNREENTSPYVPDGEDLLSSNSPVQKGFKIAALTDVEENFPWDSETDQPVDGSLINDIVSMDQQEESGRGVSGAGDRSMDDVVANFMLSPSLGQTDQNDLFENFFAVSPLKSLTPSLASPDRDINDIVSILNATFGLTTSRRKTAENIVLDYVTGETPKSRSTSSSDSKEAAFVRELKARLTEYRNAAVLAHKEGKKPREAELMVAINALAEAIPRIESGVEQFDPADMPPPPEQFHLPPEALAEVTEGIQQGSSAAQSSASPPLGKGQPLDPTVAAITKVASSTVASRESLTARIQILKAMIQKADASDKRLYERTLQSYNKALRAFEAGIKFNYGGLNPLPSCPQFTSAAPPPQPSTAPTTSPAAGPASSSESRKLELLRKRQTELRVAAAQAKARGDMGAAREYLRSSLSMNNMIRSVNAGLPIDLKQLPPPPGASIAPTGSSQTQPILSGVACAPPVEFQTALVTAGNDPVAICDQLINQLEAQATEAEILSKDHREAGLSNLADKFFDLADVSRKWIALTTAYKRGSRVPKYVFEKANLSRLNMNTDLGDGVLEVTVVRGISLPVPPDLSGPSALDTYVTLELPFPSSETPQKHSTEWARHTNEPTDYGGYQASARFEVNRKARSYERLLQGIKSLKATVYYNRGLLKRPAVLGTVTAKLTELMANATHTACYDLMDGRKAAGGLLELRFRHRTPLHGAKFSAYQKPWLCISTSKTRPMPNIKK